MVELSNDRVEQILREETMKTESLATILRAVYTRYMHVYEKLLADIDALKDDEIEELRNYHEETKSLVKYYYMDIPLDICLELNEFDSSYSDKLLGPDWHAYLFEKYEEFRDYNMSMNRNEEILKAEFAEQNLTAFYSAMDSVFRESFGTSSQTAEKIVSRIAGLLFGEQQ